MNSVNREDVRKALAAVLEEVLDRDVGPIHDGMTAIELPDWDSLNHLKIIVGIENCLNVRFDLEEFSPPKSLGEFIDLICRKMI